jgi:hypothetical protein
MSTSAYTQNGYRQMIEIHKAGPAEVISRCLRAGVEGVEQSDQQGPCNRRAERRGKALPRLLGGARRSPRLAVLPRRLLLVLGVGSAVVDEDFRLARAP